MKSIHKQTKLNTFPKSLALTKESNNRTKMQEKTTFDFNKFTNNKNVDEIIDLFGEQMKQLVERKINNTNKEKPIISLYEEWEIAEQAAQSEQAAEQAAQAEPIGQTNIINVGGRTKKNKTNKRKRSKKSRKTKKRN